MLKGRATACRVGGQAGRGKEVGKWLRQVRVTKEAVRAK